MKFVSFLSLPSDLLVYVHPQYSYIASRKLLMKMKVELS